MLRMVSRPMHLDELSHSLLHAVELFLFKKLRKKTAQKCLSEGLLRLKTGPDKQS